MKPDNLARLDGDDFDGDEGDLLAADAPGTDLAGRAADADPSADVDIDEDLIDADLGEIDDTLLDDLDDLDDEVLDDEDDDEDEDDQEVALLQDLGIDLDAPDVDGDGRGPELEVGLGDEDSADDEVAA